jgi:uncharacterized membrane protein
MRPLVVACLLVAVLATAGCGTANDVSNLITSTPDMAALQVAEANASEANAAVASYFAEHGSYDGLTTDALRQLQPGLSSSVTVTASAGGYCIQSVVRTSSAVLRGPGSGQPQAGTC